MHWEGGTANTDYISGRGASVANQVAGGLRYLRDRYHGSAQEALDYHDLHNSYAGGGEVSATLHAGERVLTARQNRWFTALAKPLSALSSGINQGKLPMEVKVAMPAGTTFKIKDLKAGIIEVVDEGIYTHVGKTIAIDEWTDK